MANMIKNTGLYVLIEKIAKEKKISQKQLADAIGLTTRSYRRKADNGFKTDEINKLLTLLELELAVFYQKDGISWYVNVSIS